MIFTTALESTALKRFTFSDLQYFSRFYFSDPALIVHVKNLLEAYFNHLFVQLRINESTKKIKSLNLKFKGKKLDLKFKVFINIISEMKRIRVLIK
jgi:hypothetical protein